MRYMMIILLLSILYFLLLNKIFSLSQTKTNEIKGETKWFDLGAVRTKFSPSFTLLRLRSLFAPMMMRQMS